MKTITIKENEKENSEGIFLVNPQWVHLDAHEKQGFSGRQKSKRFLCEKEIHDKIEKGDKIFKISFEEENELKN